MVTTALKNIFLSASIPLEKRDPNYFNSADVIAIRDSVIALATVVLPKYRIIWGGHPSITPIIYYVMKKLDYNVQDNMLLYQSKYFEHIFPDDNDKFENIIITENLGEENASVYEMRSKMLRENQFSAAVFIGGMDGVEAEFKMFNELHPQAILLPVASTGAAAKAIYDNLPKNISKNDRLANDYGYMSMFKELLLEKIDLK